MQNRPFGKIILDGASYVTPATKPPLGPSPRSAQSLASELWTVACGPWVSKAGIVRCAAVPFGPIHQLLGVISPYAR